MEDLGWFRYLLPAVAGAAGVMLFQWLPNRGKAGDRRCYSSVWLNLVYLAGLGIWVVGLYSVLTQTDRKDGLNDEIWLPFLLGVFLLLFVWALLDGLTRQIDWTPTGVTFRKLFSTTRAVPWAEVTSIRYVEWAQYFRIGLADGSGFAVSTLMSGSKAFLYACEQNTRVFSHLNTGATKIPDDPSA